MQHYILLLVLLYNVHMSTGGMFTVVQTDKKVMKWIL